MNVPIFHDETAPGDARNAAHDHIARILGVRQTTMQDKVEEHMLAIMTILHEAGHPPSYVTFVSRQYGNDSPAGCLYISDDPEPEKTIALMGQIIERNRGGT